MWFLWLLVFTPFGICGGTQILALFPYPLKSHFIVFDALLVELANRGHNLTVVTSFPKDYRIENYNEIDTSHCLQIPSLLFELEYAASFYKTTFHLLHGLDIVTDFHEELLKCQPLKDLLRTNVKYDLLITEAFCTDALLPYAHLLNVPFVLLSSLPTLPWHTDRVGLTDNPSYIPFPFSDYPLTRSATFFHRLYNTVVYITARLYYKYLWEPKTNALVKKYFGPNVPPVQEIAKNTSMILSFNHFSTNVPRPLTPNVIEVGGIHVKDPQPLPQDIKKFMDEASDGVIYFCLGSLLRADTMPDTIRDAFIKAFSKFKQRILWKWENDVLPNKPTNVMIKKWMPQRDILAHPNMKLFITHGGALGLAEAVYEGVPILGIPFYGDQRQNVKSLQTQGVGEILTYDEISAENVFNKINQILTNPSYADNATKLSSIFRDRPASAIHSAVFWIEYVIRHRGASHLRPASTELQWYEYLLLDVIAFLILGAVLLFVLSFVFLRFFLRKCSSVFKSDSKVSKSRPDKIKIKSKTTDVKKSQ